VILLSAVITHPPWKGYAKQLVAHTVNTIINQNKTAFLHVYEKKLCYYIIRKINVRDETENKLWNIRKKE
jgi:hypothetical protein